MGWGMRLGVDVLWHPQDMLSQGREGKFHQMFFFPIWRCDWGIGFGGKDRGEGLYLAYLFFWTA